MTCLRSLAFTFLAFKVGTLVVNLVTFPRLRRRQGQECPALADVSILIPARDEEANLALHLPAVLRQGAAEVIVLDDQSSDRTAAVARAAGAEVLAGLPLPPGWRGKNWACHQLAQAARGDMLVFTDADVLWRGGALAALLAQQASRGVGLLSVFPRQHNATPGERLLTPLVDHVLLSLLPFPLLAFPAAAASAANGQVMAFTRDTYRRSGGHAAVRGELLEDVKLARQVKRCGERLSLVLGGDLIGVRMYRNYPQSVAGFAKSLLEVHGQARALLLGSWVLALVTYTLPLFSRRGRPLLLLGVLEGLLVRVLNGRTRPADLLEVTLGPALPLLLLPVYLRAARREVEWKGRRYQQSSA